MPARDLKFEAVRAVRVFESGESCLRAGHLLFELCELFWAEGSRCLARAGLGKLFRCAGSQNGLGKGHAVIAYGAHELCRFDLPHGCHLPEDVETAGGDGFVFENVDSFRADPHEEVAFSSKDLQVACAATPLMSSHSPSEISNASIGKYMSWVMEPRRTPAICSGSPTTSRTDASTPSQASATGIIRPRKKR